MGVLGLVVAHLVLACLLPLVSARSRRAGFAVAAVLPTAALVWAEGVGSRLGPSLVGRGVGSGCRVGS